MLDIQSLRAQFPVLRRRVNGHPLVYLDNGATTQRPARVVNKMAEYYLRHNANVHRGVHHLSALCTDANERARERVRAFINASSAEEIIFTAGTTAGINLVANSFGEAFVRPGDEILVTEMEHHSNIVPWQMLCRRAGATLKVLPVTDDGRLDLSLLPVLLTPRTRLVALTRLSNVLGTINPVRLVADAAHAVGAVVLVDAAQAVQHLPVDVAGLDCDFLAFSAHKMYGPTGVGVLYGKKSLLDKMPPWQGGGEMVRDVRFEETTYNDLPFKFEAGTPDFIGIIGVGEAIDFIDSVGMEEITARERSLTLLARDRLSTVPGLRFHGEAPESSSVISFTVEGAHPFDIGTLLDRQGIAVRTGHMCAAPLTRRFGVESMVRVSLAMYNTEEEIDLLLRALLRALLMLRG
ncbi:MAG: SufS family cysteine desulfurase [Odoribacteraceae bacterium]|jgi:cysteine desulfurase/selenocysteine lyase|nr:SufS family cysteine desulfurase [Odoribacteraceae bacterium]